MNKGKSLLEINPSLASEWNDSKNLPLTPSQVTANSGKKAWWICNKGHEWQAQIASRNSGVGCPYCKGKKVTFENSLYIKNNELAKEWHPTKNSELSPKDVTSNSHKKVWWVCKNGHEWQALISNRNNGNKCPFCSGFYATPENNLLISNPELAKEWHPTKNGNLSPSQVSPNTHKKVWWICKYNHVWQARIDSRNTGNTCPKCNPGFSKIELRLYSELIQLFDNVLHNSKIHGVESDLIIEDITLAIEIDGYPWHKGKEKMDKKKNCFFQNKNYSVLRIRDRRLMQIEKDDILAEFTSNQELNIIIELLKRVLYLYSDKLNASTKQKINNYIVNKKLINNDYYYDLLNQFPSPTVEKSLQHLYPEIANQWHPTKNGKLMPAEVFSKSNLKVWWKCNEAQDHEWMASMNNRVKNGKCPFCAGKRVSQTNSLLTKFPEISKEWHPGKNYPLNPSQVTSGSGKKVWWLCKNNPEHEWITKIAHRTGAKSGCPYCSAKKNKS